MKWRQKYNYSPIISNSQRETPVLYSRSSNVNVKMSFPSSNFEGNFSTYVFGKPFWHYRNWKLIVWHRDIYYKKKIINPFVCVEVRILLEKWYVYGGHIFPMPLLLTCRLEMTSLCLNTQILVNKKFPNSHYFYWN